MEKWDMPDTLSPIVLDGDEPKMRYSDVCNYCTHLHLEEGRVCDAFPDGIPDEIWLGENDHTEPYEGDNGIQFSPASEVE